MKSSVINRRPLCGPVRSCVPETVNADHPQLAGFVAAVMSMAAAQEAPWSLLCVISIPDALKLIAEQMMPVVLSNTGALPQVDFHVVLGADALLPG
eukprot:SAG31_NODE_31273_length_370_cov_0.597786_1_plen_95_part_01